MDYKDIAQTDRYYPYYEGFPDKTVSGLVWHTLGLLDTNEILVIGERGDKIHYEKAPAGCLFPHMEDRRFGIDVDDARVADYLSDKIFEEYFK